MSFLFEIEGKPVACAAVASAQGFRLEIGETWHDARLLPEGDGAATLVLDGRAERVFVAVEGDRCFVQLRGETFEIDRVDPIARLREVRAADSGEVLRAPMPGVVVDVPAPKGSEVAAGAAVVVIESMKLQTALAVHAPGRVVELPFAVGQSFEKGAILARIERLAEESG